MLKEFGFVRIGTAVPEVSVAGVAANVRHMLTLAAQAEAEACDIVAFPELGITGYTCADLFQHRTLLQAAEAGLAEFMRKTQKHRCVFVVGLPLAVDEKLFNCAVAVQAGKILGAVPKTILPNYREFYENRWFSPAAAAFSATVRLCGQEVPLGNDLVFEAANHPDFTFGMEICEDLWAPVPPSTRLALGGAVVIVNISASNELVGKADYRRQLVVQQSGKCLLAYVYCSAGPRESTTDLVYGGHCLAAENGRILTESARFQRQPTLMITDVDIDFLRHERIQNTTFVSGGAGGGSPFNLARTDVRRVPFETFDRPATSGLRREVRPLPFVQRDASKRYEICQEILAIQSTGLATRLQNAGIKDVVLGLSGGLDSTLALLVAVEALDRLGYGSEHIHGFALPGFGTSERTQRNVEALCRSLGVDLQIIDIRDICTRQLQVLGHDTTTHDTVYENVQARERTKILMDKANQLNALVIGTGDLSEMALGFSTYNGDQMSMYGVNAGVPKTLVTFLVEYAAETRPEAEIGDILKDILATPISPELLPPDVEGEIAHRTEEVIGPYELHDFFLYQVVRCGFTPEKTLFLASQAFGDTYSKDALRKWLRVFITRFFANQFKRSCTPDAPKVGTIALSPRGDWRMPSDATAEDWLARI
jgi:NAD+ synthase (glutamine-hydrolysing)